LFYPIGSGGKFLINCLGLSSDALLQHRDLVQAQMAGQLSTQQKLDLLQDRLRQSLADAKWDDLGLGDYQTYGTYLTHNDAAAHDPIVHDISQGQHKFFAGAHEYNTLFFMLQAWPRATVIEFTDEHVFLEWMRPGWTYRTQHRKNARYPDHLMQSWQAVRGEQWPESPPLNLAQYQALPEHVQQEDACVHQATIRDLVAANQTVLDSLARCRHLSWDCSWYRDADHVVHHVQQLYHRLELDGFDADAIRGFYHQWIACLHNLKSADHLNGLKPFYK
jgi:hypothetical protein